MSVDELLTLPQIADELGLNPASVRWWVSSDKLPARRVGRRWLVSRTDLDHFLATSPLGRKRQTEPDPVPQRFSEVSLLSRTKPVKGRP